MIRPIPGSFLEYAAGLCGKDHEKRNKVLSMYSANFGLVDFNAKISRMDRVRLHLLTQFHEAARDMRLRGQMYNMLKSGHFYTNRPKLTFEHRLLYALQDYHYGRILERQMHMGQFGKRFAFSFQPGENYNNAEGMWWLVLADMEAEGDPIIARISLNIHREGRNRVASITEIHGTEGKKQSLDDFLKQAKMPWPIFMVRLLAYQGKKAGIHVLRGISDSTQPFFHRTAFHSGKMIEDIRAGRGGEYSLYSGTFKKLGFSSPNGERFFEQDLRGLDFKTKRVRTFEGIFSPLPTVIPARLPARAKQVTSSPGTRKPKGPRPQRPPRPRNGR